MIDNIIKAIRVLEDAKAMSILEKGERGMVSPAEAQMYFAIRDALEMLNLEV